ncbi:MAG: hypothetical protein KatS3mg004_1864 [Bryobacteraceae bacterium]|nr:MAG: hypothetical protein KatS3mg004_1864 [Bryobacteraceae bacterium]
MTRAELIERIAQAIAEMEGFYATGTNPTLAQRNANPGNIRTWRDANGKPYPTYRGYVDFVQWSADRNPGASMDEISRKALEEGWRVLRVLVGQYLDGRYTQGKPPTLEEMFRVYAPAADGNHPANYARFVAGRINARPDQPLQELIDERA